MIKKIFLSVILLLAIVFLVRSVSATNNSHLTDLIGQANNDNRGLFSYRPIETNVQVLAEDNIPAKIKTISTVAKQTSLKTRTKIIVKSSSPISASHSSIKKIVPKAKTSARAQTHKVVPKTVVRATTHTNRVVHKTYYTSVYGTTMKWDATTLRYLSHIYNFDYSYTIRHKMISNMEEYARLHHVSEITMKTLNASTYQ